MSRRLKKAFSLTEVLMAAGILAIGFMLIAMIFPVGIKLTASATEKTIGTIAAKEAEAKLKLYAGYSNTLAFARFRVDGPTGLNELMLFEDVLRLGSILAGRPDEMVYPSRNYLDIDVDINDASYHWSVLCVETGNLNEVETLILVTRKISKNAKFPVADSNPVSTNVNYGYVTNTSITQNWPMPVRVDLRCIDPGLRIWQIYSIVSPSDSAYPSATGGNYINKGDTVIDSLYNGIGIEHFQVVDEDRHGIELSSDLRLGSVNGNVVTVWVVPPAAGSSRSPLVGTLSRSIVFN